MSDFASILETVRVAKEQLKAAVRPSIADLSRAVFAADPGIASVSWPQYTPYFNDGDACVFYVREPELHFSQDHALHDGDADEEGVGLSEWDLSRAPGREALREILVRFARVIQNNDLGEAMQAAFGDHVKVTLNRDGTFVVDDYGHD